jgi:DNA repair protein RecO (recombination protein O)
VGFEAAMRLYKTEAVVLRRRPLGEKDEVVTLLSPRYGKIEAAARGSRKPTSPLVGKIEPFSHLQVMLARGRSLDHLTQATLRRSWPGLRRDLDRLARASYLLELFACSTESEVESRGCFNLLLSALEQLDQGAEPGRICRWVELSLLDLVGFGPRLDACALCGSPQVGWFAAGAGGVLCSACAPEWGRRLALSPPALAALRRLRSCGPRGAARLSLQEGPARELERALQDHILCHWPQSLRSLQVLRSLRPRDRE